MTNGLSKISAIAQNVAKQAFKINNKAKFNKKYGHLVINNMPVDAFKKQTDELFKKQIKDRKTLYIVDNFVFKGKGITHWGDLVSHGSIVKSFADFILNGRAHIKTFNIAESSGDFKYKYITEALGNILESAKKGDAVNLSFGSDITNSLLDIINKSNSSFKDVKNILKETYPKTYDSKIKLLKQIAKLADKDVKINIASSYNANSITVESLSRFLTKKPENINIVANNSIVCNDKRIITHFEHVESHFEPIIHRYKILGFALNKQKKNGLRSVSLKPGQLSNFYKIKMSNKFSGLTPEQAIAKLERMNKKNNTKYKFTTSEDGKTYSLYYTYLEKEYIDNKSYKVIQKLDNLIFRVDKNNKLLELTTKHFFDIDPGNEKKIIGHSYAAPTRAAKRLLEVIE